MGIARRLGKLITSDINGMLDLLEDPADICKQAVRDMEEEIVVLDEQLRATGERLERVKAQQDRCGDRIKEAAEQLGLCFKKGDDGLARVVLKKKLEQEKLQRLLTQQQQSLSAQRAREEKQKQEFEERLNSVREKLACFNECEAAQGSSSEGSDSFAVSEDEIEIALLKAKSEMQFDSKTGDTK